MSRSNDITRPVRDAVNLTTLLRWCGRYRGTLAISRDAESQGKWRIMVLRSANSHAEQGVIFNRTHDDISYLAHLAAGAVRRTPEWHRGPGPLSKADRKRLREIGRSQGGDDEEETSLDVQEYDWDIWKSPLDEGKPVLNSKGTPVKPPAKDSRPNHKSRRRGVLVAEVGDAEAEVGNEAAGVEG